MKNRIIDYLNYGMQVSEFYYKMIYCIENSISLEQLSLCEELINGMSEFFLCCSDLAERALHKRCSLITSQYPVTE